MRWEKSHRYSELLTQSGEASVQAGSCVTGHLWSPTIGSKFSQFCRIFWPLGCRDSRLWNQCILDCFTFRAAGQVHHLPFGISNILRRTGQQRRGNTQPGSQSFSICQQPALYFRHHHSQQHTRRTLGKSHARHCGRTRQSVIHKIHQGQDGIPVDSTHVETLYLFS